MIYRDAAVTHVDCFFDWRDRLRLLVHGRAHVTVWVQTEHKIGRVLSQSSLSVLPLWRRAGPSAGYAKSTPDPEAPA